VKREAGAACPWWVPYLSRSGYFAVNYILRTNIMALKNKPCFHKSHQVAIIAITIERNVGSSLFPVGTGGLDAHGMMTGDDTGGDVWTVAGAW
jgi:hypothetical protein